MPFQHVTILGAGITGLMAAWKLQEKGIQTLVLEKEDQVGGLAKTIHWKNFRFDVGPHSFYNNEQIILDEMIFLMGRTYQTGLRQHQVYYQNQWIPFPLTTRTLLQLPTTVLQKAFGEWVRYQSKQLTPKKKKEKFARFHLEEKTLWDKLSSQNILPKLWDQRSLFPRPNWTTLSNPGLSKEQLYKNIWFSLFQVPETTTETFHFPSEGFGSLAEQLKIQIEKLGGVVLTRSELKRVIIEENEVKEVHYKNNTDHWKKTDFVISTIPVSSLLSSLDPLPKHMLLEKSFSFPTKKLIFLCMELKDTEADAKMIYDFPEGPFFRASFLNQTEPSETSCLMVEWEVTETLKHKLKKETFLEQTIETLEKSGLIDNKNILETKMFVVEVGDSLKEKESIDKLREIKSFITGIQRLRSIGWHGKLEAPKLSQSIKIGLEAARLLIDSAANSSKISSPK